MYPDTLIGNYVTLYGICIAIGVVACIALLRILGKRLEIDKKFLDYVEILAYIVILIGFVSASLFQSLYDYIDNPSAGFKLFSGGITFIGGLIGGAGSFILIYNLQKKKLTGRIVEIMYVAPACICIAHGFGRVGCFFAGCCGGNVASPDDALYFLAMKFPQGSGYVMKYPIQLFEAIFLFILALVFFLLIWKKKFKYSFPIYLFAYGIWRFLIEFARGDDRGSFIPGISPSQFWSILMVLLAVPVYYLIKYLIKTRPLAEKDINEVKAKQTEKEALKELK